MTANTIRSLGDCVPTWACATLAGWTYGAATVGYVAPLATYIVIVAGLLIVVTVLAYLSELLALYVEGRAAR